MAKRKLEKEYRVLCLAIIAIVCIILTGAGHGHTNVNETINKSSNKNLETVGVKDREIGLETIISEDCILRINYDIKDNNNVTLGMLKGYTGDMQLLGSKLDKSVAFDPFNRKDQEWFPTLWFDAYDWIDEEKGAGTISLVITNESKLAFKQMQNTTLYAQLPDYATDELVGRDSRSVQKTKLYTNYNLQKPIEGLKTMVKLPNQIKINRDIDVIIPEIL